MELTLPEIIQAEGETARKFANRKARLLATIERELSRPRLVGVRGELTWHKSRTWGYNPRVELFGDFADGAVEVTEASVSGCGYCKASAALAQAFEPLVLPDLLGICQANGWQELPGDLFPAGCRQWDRRGFLPHLPHGIGVRSLEGIIASLGFNVSFTQYRSESIGIAVERSPEAAEAVRLAIARAEWATDADRQRWAMGGGIRLIPPSYKGEPWRVCLWGAEGWAFGERSGNGGAAGAAEAVGC